MNPKDNIQKLMDEKSVEFRDFRLTAVESRKAEDGTEGLVVEGVACSFNQETVLFKCNDFECREVVAPEAFANCDMTDVIFNYNHSGRVYARTRNKSLELWIEEDGLHMRSFLMADDEGHKALHRDIKSGLIDKMSFAFHVRGSSFEYIEADGEPLVEIRTITDIDKLYDVSAVDIPAYDTTSISARGAFAAEREKRRAEADKRKAELELAKAKFFYSEV